jgi:hypothetical protein
MHHVLLADAYMTYHSPKQTSSSSTSIKGNTRISLSSLVPWVGLHARSGRTMSSRISAHLWLMTAQCSVLGIRSSLHSEGGLSANNSRTPYSFAALPSQKTQRTWPHLAELVSPNEMVLFRHTLQPPRIYLGKRLSVKRLWWL